MATVLRFAFGSISDSFLPVAAAVALGIAALALPLAGFQGCFGSKGCTIAAMSMIFPAGLLLWFLAPRLRWTTAEPSRAGAPPSAVSAKAGASSRSPQISLNTQDR